MKKLLIVTCTKSKDSTEFKKRPIYKSLEVHCSHNSNIEYFVFKNNQEGLSTCYNKILRDETNIDKTVLFVHDDVELDDLFLYEKLTESPYSITGLAGSKTFNKNIDKLAWHFASKELVGEVAHKHSDGRVWTTCFGHTNSRALVLDGLFLSCKVKDLVEKDLEFDETFKYHFYDLAFCLRANEKRVTCGVIPLRVIHHGLGDSMFSQEWEESNVKFKSLYCK
jgi:hypothetical protein